MTSLENLHLDRIFKHCDIKEIKEEVSLFCYLDEFYGVFNKNPFDFVNAQS